MSNYKSTLQSNNTALNANNIDLQSLIDQANALPDAGSAEPTLQDKIVTPTTSKQTITADSGYDGLDTVTVNAMPTATRAETTISVSADDTNDKLTITASNNQSTGYVTGSNKTASKTISLIASGATVTASDGTNSISKSVATATQATPSISINSSGLITASATQTAGYVTVGTKSSTKQLTTQAAKTITPSTLDQVAISSGVYATGTVTVKGDSNLVAANIVKGKSIFGVAGNATTGGGSGDTSMEDALLAGTSTEYINDRVTTIRNYAFCSYTSLTLVSFPVCISTGDYTFYRCTNLTSVNFPACTNIGSGAFSYCSNLTSVNFPVCTSIGGYAFNSCSSLTSVNFPVCTNIGKEAFYRCSSLTLVSFPVCTTIAEDAFNGCTNLTSINLPACITIGGSVFASCSRLTSINLTACTTIGNSAFRSCYTLSSLTLGASTVCTLRFSNTFSSTPYAGYSSYFSGTPYIYVPASLLTAYKTATNWTYFSSYFSVIEGNGDSGSGDSGSGDLISFTIYGNEYQAQDGMTWVEWVDSEYNTDGFSIIDDEVFDSEYDRLYDNTDGMPKDVNATDIIKNGGDYGGM